MVSSPVEGSRTLPVAIRAPGPQCRGEIVLTVGRPGSRTHPFVDLDRGVESADGIIHPAQAHGQQAQIPIHGAGAAFRVADRVASGVRLELVVQDRRRRRIPEQGAGLTGQRRPQQPFIVVVERAKLIPGEVVEDHTRIVDPIEVKEQQGKRRAMEGVPREILHGRPYGSLFLGDSSLLAAEQEAVHPAGGVAIERGHGNPPNLHLAPRISVSANTKSPSISASAHRESHAKPRRSRLAQVLGQSSHGGNVLAGFVHQPEFAVVHELHHVGIDQALRVIEEAGDGEQFGRDRMPFFGNSPATRSPSTAPTTRRTGWRSRRSRGRSARPAD